MTNKSKEITYFTLFLQIVFGCIYPDMCIAYSFGFVWLHFSGHVYCIHFGFVFFGSLYIQVIQGFIHDDHEDLINKHVMMIRVTDNI
jgi:hypothetical protein